MTLSNDIDTSPIGCQLSWFENQTIHDILSKCEESYKKQLKEHVLAVISRLNKGFHDKIDAWHYVSFNKQAFGPLLKASARLALSQSGLFDITIHERYQLLTFFNHVFNSIDVDFVHDQIKRYLPLTIWINLSDQRRRKELSRLTPRIQMAWRKLEEQDHKMNPELLKERMFERKFLFDYVKQFLRILQSAVMINDAESEADTAASIDTDVEPTLQKEVATYCQRFLEFMIDIESQLPLRRFFHVLLDHCHFIVRCQLSELARHKSAEGHLFSQLVDLLQLYYRYDVNLLTGNESSDLEMVRNHEDRIYTLQKVMWTKYDHLKDFAIKPVKAIDNPTTLYNIITSFDSKEELFDFVKTISISDESNLDEDDRDNAPLMASIVMNHYRRYESQLKKIASIPSFPNETVIWDTNLVPDQYYDYDAPLALPKLNIQFLTMSDYLLRNFMLFKNESTYEIRQDIEDGIRRSKCRWTQDGKFATGPKQRMALIIKDFSILEVGKPKLGESCPSKVRARLTLNMDYVKPEWRREWEQLRKHDTCFLVSFRQDNEKDQHNWPNDTFPANSFIKYVRGCEIEAILDSDGKIVDENLEKPNYTSNLRTILVLLDCNQYKLDQDAQKEDSPNIYAKFHLIVRRKPEKNNFKGVLDTIKTLIDTKFVVPDWLRSLLLGYGDPMSAHHTKLNVDKVQTLDYYDTFIDYDHATSTLQSIKPDYSLDVSDPAKQHVSSLVPPFKVTIDDAQKKLTVIPYLEPLRGPYPSKMPKRNTIRFTNAQVNAITSGLQKGLTMVVGPPGTGKTDVAVQILSSLYHTYPDQRTLIVTHSNQALNQIFEKMIELDIKEHHLLRLGHGEEDIQSNKDFSRRGRIRHVLARRLELLVEVSRLARAIDLDPGQGFTCESADYFNFYHIISRWQEYIETIKGTNETSKVGALFPFKQFFADAPQPLFKGESITDDFEVAKGCYRYIQNIFDELQEFRPFEIFSNQSDRSQYLLIRVAKFIAMTCTHAGLRRKELVDMNFQYDNILMEETAQILEIETTIPLLLQNPENGVNRLKRWIMIGDHNQLPPIIQNTAFQKFSNMEQSLFARFVRLGVPAILLDAQGRARPSLCDLYRWRYKDLRDLPHIGERAEYAVANAGFAFDYQLINVDDYKGQGETAPMPYHYQNRGEAEYVVAVYKYMRTLGYPADKITILTTYNGQKELLREIVERECTSDAHLGSPSKISTVDKYQGQQNDYILLSLVRTRTVGHLRDIRRLVVAMSRARLGLYIFARVSLFQKSFELRHTMKLLSTRPQQLVLLPNESFPTQRPAAVAVDTRQGHVSKKQRRQQSQKAPQIDGSLVIEKLENMIEFTEKKYAAYALRESEKARSPSMSPECDD